MLLIKPHIYYIQSKSIQSHFYFIKNKEILNTLLAIWCLSIIGVTLNPFIMTSKNTAPIIFFNEHFSIKDHLHIKIKFPVLRELVILYVTAI